jgi:queuine/archaeosine tRNA-ribosyltransferase
MKRSAQRGVRHPKSHDKRDRGKHSRRPIDHSETLAEMRRRCRNSRGEMSFAGAAIGSPAAEQPDSDDRTS